jgi:ketosteroid isomerase-like protein
MATGENEMQSKNKISMSNDERKIHALVNEWAKALREKHLEKLMSFYERKVVLFDIAPPLQYSGAEIHKKSLEEWFSSFDGPIGYEVTDLEIVTSGEVAFLHSINHLSGKRESGEQTDVWMRVTIGLHKIDDVWLIMHEHVSVPFYMDGSYRAAVDLKP